MRVQRKEIKKPNSERVRYAMTEITEKEYKTIMAALELAQIGGGILQIMREVAETDADEILK